MTEAVLTHPCVAGYVNSLLQVPELHLAGLLSCLGVIKPRFAILPCNLQGSLHSHLTELFSSPEAAQWYNRCICLDCREQATHSMAWGLAGHAGAARKSCDTNGTSQTRTRSKSDLVFFSPVFSESLLKPMGIKL